MLSTAATIFTGVAFRTGAQWASFDANPELVTKALLGVGTAIYTGYVIADEINKCRNASVNSKKYEKVTKLPTPKNNPGEITKKRGGQGWVRNKTGENYKKSYTSHGNKNNKGDQWKVRPKGTEEGNMGNNSKQSGERTTLDHNGAVIGD